MNTINIYSLFKNSAGVNTDSRSVKKSEIFFALRGEKYNGNKYAGEALEKGALCAIIDDCAFETGGTIRVDDAFSALQALALHHRKMLNITTLAITGSNGKTTTKELIASILSKRKKIHFTKGNLNNHIGVPLSILSTPAGTEFLVIEMGASHIGEIGALCNIACPDYGIITNIGTAHIEGFGSFEGVIKAKTELYEYLQKTNGVAIYNDLNPLLSEKIANLVGKAIPYNRPDGMELSIESLESDLFLKIKAAYKNKEYIINTNLFGSHNIENIKAAVAAGLVFNISIEEIISAVEEYRPENNRSQVKNTGKNVLICDSYNANPSSMAMALRSFSKLDSNKKAVVLGDMLELGEKSEQEHLKILQEISFIKPENVFLVGQIFGKIAANSDYRLFENAKMLRDYLTDREIKDFVILIKGSRGIGLEKMYDVL
jgi:UDP-N-acetylmuramoyl-tripeptide--D-alanyl-D-alanine ligase